MRVLFLGSVLDNTGPANANRKIVEHWPKDDELVTLSAKSRQGRVVECIRRGFSSDVVLSPGSGIDERIGCRILSAMGKPVVCFNHGYLPYENQINHLGYSPYKVKAVEKHLRNARCIVANSELQASFITGYIPDMQSKVTYAHLGVDYFEQVSRSNSGRASIIAVSGGSRPIKGNDVVAHAVSILHARSVNCEFRVYGRLYSKNDEFSRAVSLAGAELKGQVSQEAFAEELRKTSLFVMNSRHEPFGLSAIDALREGASLLLSRNCGVAELLSLESCDVVDDCENAEEVAQKMLYLLEHPNSARLYGTLAFDAIGWDTTSAAIRGACVKALHHEY